MAKDVLTVTKAAIKSDNPLKNQKFDYILTILNQKYKVFEVNLEEVGFDGFCFAPPVRKILIHNSTDPFEKLDTFLHELFHAILYEFGLKSNHPERVINFLAAGLAHYLTNAENRKKLLKLVKNSSDFLEGSSYFKNKLRNKN